MTASLESALGSSHVGTLEIGTGLAPIPLAAPRDEAQAVELLQLARRDRLRILPLGGGSKLCWCRPPSRADFALSTRALSGVVAYEPGDGTITARAGTRMSELAEVVRAGGHRLTPAVARASESSLGGVIAAGVSGPDRLRFGPARHHLLGTRTLMASGEITRSGGRLVKNVTGYDLHRLYCGSHGSLCLIVEASLRLFPLPDSVALGTAGFGTISAAFEAARRLVAAEPCPTSITIDALDPSSIELAVQFDGREEVVRWEHEQTCALLPELEWVEGTPAAHELTEREPDAREGAVLRVSSLPEHMQQALVLSRAALEKLGLEFRAFVQPGIAIADLPVHDLAPSGAAGLVHELRARLAPLGARLGARGIDWSRAGELDPFGDPGPALPLMHRLRTRLDPDGRFAAGRFHGGL